MRKDQLLAGFLSPLVALSGIGAAMIINRSWWRLTDNAISDMGKVGLPYNWVINVPLLISAIMGLYYALGLFREFKNSITRIGIGLFALGLVFLAGISLFPEGTRLHYPVSWGFFLAGSLGFLITGVALWLANMKGFGIFTVLLFTGEVTLARWAFGEFKGVAIPEFIGIFAIVTWHYALLWNLFLRKKE
ncbi:hypothetical protein A3L12_07240 [Thermococcus sp. P6]|uniref:DUF998 domain-containing protein n=1 Tax=Thermococcus sp. P6 TaxID=122420 RepID=UPI000B599CCF|nr:DUF998 domain-containing protein [Thermococcus sp. P6]ASJ11106.1 hypothetical protein A3L12_07240 [Thermococcus sp. P6]